MKKDNIEDIYSELEAFSKEPPKVLWDNIEARLHSKKKRRGIFFIWGSAAAVLLIVVGYIITSTPESNNLPDIEISDIEHAKENDTINESETQKNKMFNESVVSDVNEDSIQQMPNTEKELLKNVAIQEQILDRNEILKKQKEQNNLAENFNKESIYNKEEKSKHNNSYSQDIKKDKIDEISKKDALVLKNNNESIADYEKEKGIASNDSIPNVKEESPFVIRETLLAENENIIDSIITSAVASSKWSVEVLGGLSNTASESSIQGISVNTTSQNDFVYALKVGYFISDRLVIKSGIGKNVLGQEINNIKYTNPSTTLSVENVQSIVESQEILFLVSPESITDFSTSEVSVSEGDLQQQFDYIQVPIEISYNLLKEQKYNLSLGVGGNVNFLTNNRAFLNNEEIGESLGANSTILGATINSNISYELAKKIILFVEPSYNYFEKPIDNNNQVFSNTQFRVLFGLRYKL